MTDFPTTHRDLLDAEVATLATLDAEGFPQLTEVWFLHDEGEIRLSLNTERWKSANLERDGRCSLLILDLQKPSRYLEVRGRARVEPDDDYTFATRLGDKYGADVRAYDGPGSKRLVVTMEPVKVYPVDMGA